MNIALDDFRPYGEKVIKAVKDYAEKSEGWEVAPDNYEGIRVSFNSENGDGWFLLRMSLHEPLMPLNIESNVSGGVKTIAQKLYLVLKNFDKLDTQKLSEFVK